jgi:hypothetical protein
MKNSTLIPHCALPSSVCLINEFQTLAEQLRQVYAARGIRVGDYESPHILNFSKIGQVKQMRAIESMTHLLDAVRDHGDDGVDRTKKQIWRILKSMKCSLSNDLIDRVNDQMVVELYAKDQAWIYGNDTFRELNSYSYASLHSHTWEHLYARDVSAVGTVKIMFAVVKSQALGKTCEINYGPYEIKELYSEKQGSFKMTNLSISPLLKDGKIHGSCIISRVER